MPAHPGSTAALFDVLVLLPPADGLDAVSAVLADLSTDLPAAVLIGPPPTGEVPAAEVLGRHLPHPTLWAKDGMVLQPGCVYVAPPQTVLEVRPGGCCAVTLPQGDLPSERPLDRLLASLAVSSGARTLAAILTELEGDGVTGARALRGVGGTVLVQQAAHAKRPRVVAEAADRVVPPGELGRTVTDLLTGKGPPEAAAQTLRANEEKYRALFEQMDEAYAVVEVMKDAAGRWTDFRFLEVNAAFMRHTGMPYPVGRTATELLGTPNPRWAELYGRAVDTGESVRVEESELTLGRVFDLNIFRLGDEGSRRVAVLFTDITERKQAEEALRASEERQTFLLGLSDILQRLTAPNDIKAAAMHRLGTHLGVSRAQYHEVDPSGEYYSADGIGYADGLPLLDLKYRIDQFGRFVAEDFKAGRPFRSDDLLTDPRPTTEEREAYGVYGIRAGAGIPLLRGGKLVAILAVHDRHPHAWTDLEMALIRETAERIWVAVEKVRAETHIHESGERQAFLLRLNDGLRAQTDPETIGAFATRMVAEHLRLDRCYISEVFGEQGFSTVGPEHRRPDLAPMSGVFRLSEYPETMRQLATEPMVVRDADGDGRFSDLEKELLAGLHLRALVVAPIRKGPRHVVWALAAAMATPRGWTDGERTLLEEVAERTWAAIERARAEEVLRASEERQAFLLRLSDALRPLADAAEIEATTTRLLAEHLGVDRAMYAEVEGEPGAETGTVRGQYVRPVRGDNPALAPFPERFTYEQYGAMPKRYRGDPLVVADIESAPGFAQAERAAWAEGKVRAAVVAPLAKGGRLVAELGVQSVTARVWTDADVALVQDVAERTWAAVEWARTEAALRESETRYRTLFETMGQGYCQLELIRDADGRAIDQLYLELNPAFERLFGIPAAEAKGRRASEVFAEVDSRWHAGFDRVARGGAPERMEQQHGGRWYEAFAYPAGGDRVNILYEDVTDRKQAEIALRESEERQAFLLRLSDVLRPLADPVEIIGAATRLLGEGLGASRAYYAEWPPGTDDVEIQRDYAAPGLPSLVGRYPIENFRSTDERFREGRTWVVEDVADGTIPAAERDYCLAHGVAAWVDVPLVKGGKLQAALFLVQDAPRCWNATEIALAEETAERTWAAVERARAEEALVQSEGRLRALIEHLPGGAVFVVDHDLRYVLAQGEALATIGLTPEDLVGRTVGQTLAPELAAEYEALYRQTLAGEGFDYEHTAHGRTFITRGVALRNAAGNISAALAVSYDITERKRAEEEVRALNATLEERVEERTRRLADLNAELGALIIRTARNLEAPVGYLSQFLDPGRKEDLLTELSPHDPSLLEDELARLRGVSEDLRELARLEDQHLNRGLLPLGELFEEVRAGAAQGRRVQWLIEPLPIVRADRALLKQALEVLLTFTLSETRGARYVDVGSQEVEGEVWVTVRDDGTGLSGEEAATLFDLSVRTEQSVPLLAGSGLIQVRRILACHGGWAWAESSLNGGKVVLAFPRDEAVSELEALFREERGG